MSTIVHQHDKRIDVTYAYESTSYWDKEKKQSRAKRKLIGIVDPETGEIKPTTKKKRGSAKPTEIPSQIGSAEAEAETPWLYARRTFYGATYLLDKIGEKTGLADDLQVCFPDTYNLNSELT